MKNSMLLTVLVFAVILLTGLLNPLLPGIDPLRAMEENAEEETPGGTAPHWAYSKVLWAAMVMSFSVLGTSWAQSRIGVAGAGAMAEKPELSGTYILLIAIPETMVILGFVVASIILVMT